MTNMDDEKATATSRPTSKVELGRRITTIANRFPARRDAAKAAGVSVDSLQRHMRGENVPAFDAAAGLCLAAGVRMEWLATGSGPMLESEARRGSQSVQPDPTTLQNALELIDRALPLLHRTTDASGRAHLVGVAYKIFAAHKSAADALQEIVQAIEQTGE